jgi:hypothetical protein
MIFHTQTFESFLFFPIVGFNDYKVTWELNDMNVIGTNTWEADMDKEVLKKMSLAFADRVKAQGIARLLDAWMSPDKKILWCSWETDNLEALKAAFLEMNKQSGLKSVLEIYENYTPK